MTDQPKSNDRPSVAEIAALTRQLREITAQGRAVDPAERARFLAAKDALIARITSPDSDRTRAAAFARDDAQDAITDAVRASAEHPGYVTVGPSARTWLRDPDTGQPAAPVSEHEHRVVRDLLQREELDTTAPAWVTGPDGHSNVHSIVYPAGPDAAIEVVERVEDAPADGELHRHIARTRRIDAASDAEPWAPAESHDRTAEAATFYAAGYYTDAHLDAIAYARDVGDTERAERLQGTPWSAPADAVQVPRMPEWMGDQAQRTEAEIADGTYVAGQPDDLARLADRLAALRGQGATDDSVRQEQLKRWHTDDTADAVTAPDVHGQHVGADDVHRDDDGPGRSRTATDDGPGLP